jgi:hypothetical protein
MTEMNIYLCGRRSIPSTNSAVKNIWTHSNAACDNTAEAPGVHCLVSNLPMTSLLIARAGANGKKTRHP